MNIGGECGGIQYICTCHYHMLMNKEQYEYTGVCVTLVPVQEMMSNGIVVLNLQCEYCHKTLLQIY